VSLFRKNVKGFTREETITNLTYPGTSRYQTPIGIDSSLRLAAVFACVRYISETVASLPVHLYRREGDKRIQLEDPAWLVKPNAEMNRFELFERTLAGLNLDGNAFWYYDTDRLGRVAEVWPVHPTAVQVRRTKEARVEYRIAGEVYDERNIVHIRAFAGPGGLRGLSPIELFRQGALALTSSAEEYGTKFFQNDARPGGVISAPETVSDAALTRMAGMWKNKHQGLNNSHEPGFLLGGSTWQDVQVPNDHAQFLETRKFQNTEIARIFRVPPHKIADLERATFSNIEHQNIEAVTDCIRPWCVRIEIAASPLIPGDAFMRFNLNGLLRGDTMSRYASYNMGINAGWLKPDEPRAWEDLDPMPDGAGQIFRAPLNTTPVNGDPEPLPLNEQVDAATALIRAGYDPTAALVAVGLDPIRHTGLLPITVQKPEESS
jgi:HK97 family phage portal protein